jgi:TonB family protein
VSNPSTVGTGSIEQEETKMFDKLIESNSVEADFKPRGRYFTVSSVIVGILFLTAVVVSLYAQDLDLGTDNFDIAELLAPIAPETPQPPEPRQQTLQNSPQRSSDVPQRRVNMQDINEPPTSEVAISVTPNTHKSRPPGDFVFGRHDIDPAGPASSVNSSRESGGGTSAGPADDEKDDRAAAATVTPPPIKAIPPPTRVKSEGVINGKAIYLPKPPYPAPAQMVGAQGEVSVQVTVDETGKVISSKALTGHPMLRGPAEKAAWSAKFSPTYLSKVPVKVTGVIVYKFAR